VKSVIDSLEIIVADSAGLERLRRYTDMPLLDPKIRGLSVAIALNLVLDGLSLVERTQAPNERRNVCFQE